MNYDYEEVLRIANELRTFNFTNIINHNRTNKAISFCDYIANTTTFEEEIVGYCRLCGDEIGGYKAEDEKDRKKHFNYRLNNISHGTHSFDFLQSFGISDIEEYTEGWDGTPVLFLMENPSKDYNIYDYIPEESDNRRRPAKNWYWIHESKVKKYQEHKYENDDFFIQGKYGDLVATLINQNKLANAYLTNIVKCGMSDAHLEEGKLIETGFSNLDCYEREVKKNCIERVLKKEIETLIDSQRKLVVFAFGERTFWLVSEYLKCCDIDMKYKIAQLPHPANRLKNEYRKYALKGIVKDTLSSDKWLKPGDLNSFVFSEEEIRGIFKDEWRLKDEYPVGKKQTKSKRLALHVKKESPLFSKFEQSEMVTEIWLKGKNSITGQEIGIGYLLDEKRYWGWDYETDCYIEFREIPFADEFVRVIDFITEKSKSREEVNKQ